MQIVQITVAIDMKFYAGIDIHKDSFFGSGRAIMMQTKYMKHYCRIKQRKGKQVARRSAARKMLSDVWYVMRNEIPYES